MSSKYPSEPLQKIRALYMQSQKEINNKQLNRITEERMKKRYSYVAKEVEKKQQANERSNIEELIFYRNKFHSLLVLVGESMRESYNRNKFQTEVKNILNQNWQEPNHNLTFADKQQEFTNNNRSKTPNKNQVRFTNPQAQIRKEKQPSSQRIEIQNKSYQLKESTAPNNRSLSPLEEFFQGKQKQIMQRKKTLSFQSVVPQSQLSNSKLLADMKNMNKKSNGNSSIRDVSRSKALQQDSRVRELRRQNEQLQKILLKRQKTEEVYRPKQSFENLQKQVLYYQRANKELRQQTGYTQKDRSLVPYSISYRKNNVNQIQSKNYQYNTSRRAMQYIDKSKLINKSQTKSNSLINDQKSNKSNTSSVVQKQKQVYINNTPQVLFQNQLIKVMVIRFPLKIQQKNFASGEKLNPEDLNPNEQRLQLIVLNNASKIVRNQQLLIKLDYDYDNRYHKLQSYKKPNTGYSKIADTSRDIVFREIVKVKLLSTEGYNEQIKALIKAEFSYDPKSEKKRIFYENSRNKTNDNFSIQIKLPVTFIEFSRKPFSQRDPNSKKTKLTIKPNPLYDTLQHTYMNTSLPFLKSSNHMVLKQNAVLYGRSFVHDKNGQGAYLESQISLAWFEKKDVRYISIETIQEWAYLLAYIFLDVDEEEEQEFQKEFRKPSVHVFFNLENKQVC